jgi:hypothetical protein
MRNQINKLNRIRVEGNPVINTINTLNTNLRNTFNRGTTINNGRTTICINH